MLKAKDIKPKRPADRLLKHFQYLMCSQTYNAAEDGLPKPKITKDDLESWN